MDSLVKYILGDPSSGRLQGLLTCAAGILFLIFREKFSRDSLKFNQLIYRGARETPVIRLMPIVLSVLFIGMGLLLFFGVVHPRR